MLRMIGIVQIQYVGHRSQWDHSIIMLYIILPINIVVQGEHGLWLSFTQIATMCI